MIRTEKPVEDVDGLLLKAIDAPTQKEKKTDREAKGNVISCAIGASFSRKYGENHLIVITCN